MVDETCYRVTYVGFETKIASNDFMVLGGIYRITIRNVVK